jgi:hypothetical protein
MLAFYLFRRNRRGTSHPSYDREYAKLAASTRYTQHDLIVDGITAIAATVVILVAMSQLGSN